ncbi:uncharacterized protein BCR38DRAFT_415222 [Pseudomassariella vexata]|uniref:Uncharacterized protein n=1 Tax=Pseudomassariella vexata TaxID=1141098 RepID=A0A1Y2D5Z4_9PEZI|nr:uncharacterized protein BCR38DRAFT_415222 [Pseudomassariella vexata]ORY54728.1 hypothetical protein BCR38DRAFT_415222 [Pseudomassariella vexata]
MQLKNTALLILASAFVVLASLPRTFELLAFKDEVQVGCVNNRGNFITNHLYCIPFNSNVTVDPTTITAYNKCSCADGMLNCYNPQGAPSLFTKSGADMSLDGFGTAFSVDSWPVSTDEIIGVPLKVGIGMNGTIILQVKAVSG